MIKDLQLYHNDIEELSKLSYTRYENIFQIAKNNNYYFYNILKKINFPDNIDSRSYNEVIVSSSVPYTTLSFKYYDTQDLWWLICMVNNIKNPITNIKAGTKLKILSVDAVNQVLAAIDNTIKN
tara:strand:- start:4740 stop:5111 length:372 start_codon:yes stop_codon:yes gene_type:complete